MYIKVLISVSIVLSVASGCDRIESNEKISSKVEAAKKQIDKIGQKSEELLEEIGAKEKYREIEKDLHKYVQSMSEGDSEDISVKKNVDHVFMSIKNNHKQITENCLKKKEAQKELSNTETVICDIASVLTNENKSKEKDTEERE